MGLFIVCHVSQSPVEGDLSCGGPCLPLADANHLSLGRGFRPGREGTGHPLLLTIPASVLREFITKRGSESEKESLIVKLRQLIAQDYAVVHASSCDSDQVDDTPTGAIPAHGQSDSVCGEAPALLG